MVFSVDGKTYNVAVGELKRSASMLDGSQAGRLQTGRMERALIGVYYNYALSIDTKNLNRAEYDALYEVLTAPVDYHVLTVPYGQGTKTFEAYIANVDDTLQRMREGKNLWGGLSINFIAMEPARTP